MDAILTNVSSFLNSSFLQDFWNGPLWNNYYYIIVGVVAIFLIYKLISLPFQFVLNGVIGCAMLLGVNWVGSMIHFSVPVNILTSLVAGIFGIPGIIGIVIYYGIIVHL